MTSQLRIGIIGSGATGGYLAGYLTHHGIPVTLVARAASLAAIRAEGLCIHDHDGTVINTRPAQLAAPGEKIEPVDVAFFCVKSYDTGSAAKGAAALIGDNGRLLCTQNGVENETLLARRFGAQRVMAGVMYIGTERTAPNVVRCHTKLRMIFGPTHESNRALADLVHAMMVSAGIDCTLDEDILASKWQKFLFNCGLNPLTALMRMKLGAIMANPEGRRLFDALIDEAIAVARAHGAPLKPDARQRVGETGERMNISSSMAEDLAASRRIELDAFSGLVRRLGEMHKIATPVTDVVYRLLAVMQPNPFKS